MVNKRFIMLRLLLTLLIVAGYLGILVKLEYLQQLRWVDNLIGAMPVVLLTGIGFFLVLLVWKIRREIQSATIVLAILTVLWGLLLIPAITGNWFPGSRIPETGSASPVLSKYEPFLVDTKVAKLTQSASLSLDADLPRLDGALALYPLYASFVQAVYDEEAFSEEVIACSNTPRAYEAIISGERDIIFVAGPSDTQLAEAEKAGVELVFTEIGKEAFVFLVGDTNPIDGLTQQQLRNIYSGKTAKWRTLGWKDGGKMIVYQRPEGSGSQTGLQAMMGELPIQKPQPLPDDQLFGTGSMMKQVSVKWQGVQPAIGYSYRYFAQTMYPNDQAKLLAIDGVYPSNETIAAGEYPFASGFYAVTRGEPVGNAKRLIDWILSEEGQYLVEETGYVPLEK
ncbi:substrate-binding domain-containing protein [Enterococcus sp. 669A]|uniref:Substrate-binding domain-containing protein n=1 Tax=Candidatus Enterococcus moelleringii TaxID=2815325 RepID=A0ABS3LG09_9ENTE|nr:substrate-binding domain-containing protein [Enterococcus sp. 669A]MBO1308577.1 substrate-binding domain-containing protein [Enterococcus sp. 669A]